MDEIKVLDKLERMKDDFADKFNTMIIKVTEIQTNMQSSMQAMSEVKAKLDKLKVEIDEVKVLATEAKNSTDSAHKRLNDMDTDIRPLIAANLSDRIKSLEASRYWIATLVIGSLVTGAIAAMFFAKGG